MKRYLLLAAMLVGSVSISHAVTKPVDQSGKPVESVDLVGVDSTRITISTGTNAVLAENEAGLLYGVVTSSCAVTNYVVLRDSATANTSSTPLWTAWCEDTGADEDGTIIHKLPAPIKFSNGLSANMNAALTGAGEVLILTRPRGSGAD